MGIKSFMGKKIQGHEKLTNDTENIKNLREEFEKSAAELLQGKHEPNTSLKERFFEDLYRFNASISMLFGIKANRSITKADEDIREYLSFYQRFVVHTSKSKYEFSNYDDLLNCVNPIIKDIEDCLKENPNGVLNEKILKKLKKIFKSYHNKFKIKIKKKENYNDEKENLNNNDEKIENLRKKLEDSINDSFKKHPKNGTTNVKQFQKDVRRLNKVLSDLFHLTPTAPFTLKQDNIEPYLESAFQLLKDVRSQLKDISKDNCAVKILKMIAESIDGKLKEPNIDGNVLNKKLLENLKTIFEKHQTSFDNKGIEGPQIEILKDNFENSTQQLLSKSNNFNLKYLKKDVMLLNESLSTLLDKKPNRELGLILLKSVKNDTPHLYNANVIITPVRKIISSTKKIPEIERLTKKISEIKNSKKKFFTKKESKIEKLQKEKSEAEKSIKDSLQDAVNKVKECLQPPVNDQDVLSKKTLHKLQDFFENYQKNLQ